MAIDLGANRPVTIRTIHLVQADPAPRLITLEEQPRYPSEIVSFHEGENRYGLVLTERRADGV